MLGKGGKALELAWMAERLRWRGVESGRTLKNILNLDVRTRSIPFKYHALPLPPIPLNSFVYPFDPTLTYISL